MKKLAPAVIVLVMAAWPSSCPAFLDYLFSGSASRDAIDNSALGDLRAWWTGNPAYQFNPWYTPSQPGAAPGAQGQQQPGQPGSYSITPSTPMGQAPYGQPGAPQYSSQPMQGYGQPTYGGYAQQGMEQQMPQQYQMPAQQYPAAPQYQQMPQQYQQMPQQYPAAPQQYQSVPQGYQPMGQ